MQASRIIGWISLTVVAAAVTANGQQSWSASGDATAIIPNQAFGKLPADLKEKIVLQLPQRDGGTRFVFDDLKPDQVRTLSKMFQTQGLRPRIFRPVSCDDCDDSGLLDHKVPPVHNGAYGKPQKTPNTQARARPPLQGRGVRVAMIDLGKVYSDHVEFLDSNKASRVSPRASQTESDEHATADAGTLGAAGINSSARGSAPLANIVAVVPTTDYWSAVESVLDVPISSHSTVVPAGWHGQEWWGIVGQTRDAEFGRYGIDAEIADTLSARKPQHLMVVAAGNDRDDGPRTFVQPVEHLHRVRLEDGTVVWQSSSKDTHPRDGDNGGFQTVVGACVAKNVVCVGAVPDIGAAANPQATVFTNFGPTLDIRIKPDIVANGFDVFALGVKTAYVSQLAGTSQAAPMVAGIAALIKEGFSLLRGVANPTAAELKAVLLHTASRENLPPGPDPKLGWGMADAKAAADYLEDKSAIVQTVVIKPGAPTTLTFAREEDKPFRVTVVWTDPPQTQAGAEKGALVSDVDAVVVAPPNGSTTHLPWVLEGTSPFAAKRGPNHVDNVEIIDVAAGAIGTWTLRLTLAKGGPQAVAVALPGKEGS